MDASSFYPINIWEGGPSGGGWLAPQTIFPTNCINQAISDTFDFTIFPNKGRSKLNKHQVILDTFDFYNYF